MRNMRQNCKNCGNLIEIMMPSYAGQSDPTYCEACFDICFPKKENRYKQMNYRIRPEGQCFRCGKIKTELMDDPNDPTKIPFINCNQCEDELLEEYKKRGYQF